jgi:stringent starvation protein B
VPKEFVKNGEIVLNISFTATSGLKMENDLIHFHARFGGVSREISVPVDNVVAIYARENGQGMAFEVSALPARDDDVRAEDKAASPALSAVPAAQGEPEHATSSTDPGDDNDPPKKGGRPTLTRIK